jgi:hypothetical protein
MLSDRAGIERGYGFLSDGTQQGVERGMKCVLD